MFSKVILCNLVNVSYNKFNFKELQCSIHLVCTKYFHSFHLDSASLHFSNVYDADFGQQPELICCHLYFHFAEQSCSLLFQAFALTLAEQFIL